MKIRIILTLIFVLGFVLLGFTSRNTTLYFAAPNFPPWDINTDGSSSSGINADIIRSIAKELGLTPEPVKCPWKRCLLLLEEGTIDMAGTVGRTPERERFLHFIETSYAKAPDQVFYLPVEAKVDIKSYEDLYQFDTIGIERGARVFPRFDHDEKLRKKEIAKLDQLIKMLNNKRLDIIAGNEMVIDYMIKKMGLHGKFKKAYYRFVIKEMEYFAFSKKSPHFKRLPEINQILQEMKKSGKIQEYIDYYTRN